MQPSNRPLQGAAHFRRVGPVVGRAGLFLRVGADEGAVLDAGDVGRVGAGQVGIRTLFGVQFLHRAGRDHLGAQAVVLGLRAVAPVDAVGLGQGGDVGHPIDQVLLFDVSWDVQCRNATHDGLIHSTTSNANKNSGRSGTAGSASQLIACARKVMLHASAHRETRRSCRTTPSWRRVEGNVLLLSRIAANALRYYFVDVFSVRFLGRLYTRPMAFHQKCRRNC